MISASSTVRITLSVLEHNTAAGGGALAMTGQCRAMVNACEILSNQAAARGGGVLVRSGTVTLSNGTLLRDNTANDGGDSLTLSSEGEDTGAPLR